MLRLRVPVRYGTWEIACERPKHSLVSNTFCLPSIVKRYNFLKATIVIRFTLLLVCPSVPPFVLDVLFILSFHVLSGHFYV